MYDTFLTRKNRRKSDAVLWAMILRRFLLFLWLFCISLTCSVLHEFIVFRCICKTSKIVQIACKTVCFASPPSQSCATNKSILQPYFDYFALQNTQNDTPKGCERYPKRHFFHPETWFPCICERARKCQTAGADDIPYRAYSRWWRGWRAVCRHPPADTPPPRRHPRPLAMAAP